MGAPPRIAPIHRVRPRRAMYLALKTIGLPPRFLHRRLGLTPMRETFVPEATVTAWLADAGAAPLEVDRTHVDGGPESAVYWAARRSAEASPEKTP